MIKRITQGFPFPPRGLPLVTLLLLFIVTGLIGHDPWKSDDAITIGVVTDMLQRGHWLAPYLADRPYPDPLVLLGGIADRGTFLLAAAAA